MASEVNRLAQRVTRGQKTYTLGLSLVFVGLMTVMAGFIVGLWLAGLTAGYYGADKAARDGAEIGSLLLAQQGVLHTVPAWLKPLVPLGVSVAMVGIGLLLAAIVERLHQRGRLMAAVFPVVQQKRQGQGRR